MRIDVEKLIPSIFIEDINLNKGNSYISQLTILTIKSLLPQEEEVANRIDYKRFKEELKLWEGYCIGENISLLNLIKERDRKQYFSYYDEDFYTRLIPLIVANGDFKIIEEELIKNLLYFSGNVENLLEWLSIAYGVYLLVEGAEDIDGKLKEYLIKLSQVELEESFNGFFTLNEEKNKAYKIRFEKERIALINLLNGVRLNKYLNLQDLLSVIEGGDPTTSLGRIVFIASGEIDLKLLDSFYINMNRYIINLRKGRIDVDKLRIKEYVLPDIFSFNEGDVFYHSLLNYCKVLKKEVRSNVLTSLISTKSGNYLFKRDPV